MKKIRTRIAPSPTGEDLHIGNVYTALLNYAFARKNKGEFIVRIEDTDRTRFVEGSEERILDSLRWLRLHHDEGPDKKGPFGPYRQSERKKIYSKFAHELIAKGFAYRCYCTPQRLEEVRNKQMKEGKPFLYDGYCKFHKNLNTEKFVIRLNVPDEGTTVFQDMIRGKISFENKLIDDQVLIKSDGFPTYHLAVVVDDHLMEISHVIRAEEWISSTPKHVLIYKALDWEMPVFCHVPVIRNPDRSKLSKRRNPVWVSWYRKEGFLPEALLNYLALLGWSFPVDKGGKEKDLFTLEQFIEKFNPADLKPVGPAFDIKRLEWMNGEYIRQMENQFLKNEISEYIGDLDDSILGKSIPLVRERIKKLSDYLPLAGFLYKKPEEYEIQLKPYSGIISSVYASFESTGDWTTENIGKTLSLLSEKSGLKTGDFFMVIRVAVTGKKISPPLNESLEILGKDETINRLKAVVR